MSESLCPVCLGQSFSDFRGRIRAQCNTCGSLERHRSFRLFMLWAGPCYSNLVLTTSINPLRNLNQYEEKLNIELLDKFDIQSKNGDSSGKSTVVFMENIIGFQEFADTQKEKMKALITDGSLVAFTAHSSCTDNPNQKLMEYFDQDYECQYFDPKDVYGGTISEQCRLYTKGKNRGMNDIYYFTANVEEIHQYHECA